MSEPDGGVAKPAPLFYSPYAYDVHEDPYPIYARLREEAPLYRNEELDFWALSRHADVLGAFRDPAHFSNRNGVSLDPSAYGPDAHRSMSFLAMDAPRHTKMRSLVSKGFTPRRVAEMEERITAIALEHIGPAMESGTFDMVSDVAGKLPMDVISELIGVPRPDRAKLRALADLLVHRDEGVLDVTREGREAALVLAGYFDSMIKQRRTLSVEKRPEDLTSALLEVELDGERLTDDDIIAFLFLMVVAGNETTTKLIANAWYWGYRFPDQSAKVFADRTRVVDWVEETLRFDTSTQMLVRTTIAPVKVHGQVVPPEQRVLLLIGSANRDPRVFDDPDRYDLDRDTSKLVSFGSGRHFCLGASLARLEARICLDLLARQVKEYEVDEAGARRVHSINVRGFANLPTTVVAR